MPWYSKEVPTEKILVYIFCFPAFLLILAVWSFHFSEKLLRKESATSEVTFEKILKSPGENWLTYSGDYAAKRYSPLNQINVANVNKIVPRWVYHVEEETSNLRVTPLVYEGVMYITNAYEIEALKAESGQRLWRWRVSQRPEHWMNRGAALLDDKIFFITKDCVLTALDRKTGKFKWQKKYAETEKGYYSTVAPLALKNKIIVGVSVGGESARGFIAAFSPVNGEELWRFWTIPESSKLKGGAATWTTGSYDPELNLLYWTTGSPYPDSKNGFEAKTTIYSNSVLALNPDSGELKWHFQFKPFDAHHWDANEIPVLADANYLFGRSYKLLTQANRNGFFYVLDRTDGKFLSSMSFVKKMTWARGLGSNGHPVEMPGMNEPWTKDKKGICPGLNGATNWMSPSYNPVKKLFYVVVLESCDMERGNYSLKALDLFRGQIEWEYKMTGTESMYAGTVSTAGGLVFVGDDAGHLVALDAVTGKNLWQLSLGGPIFASPMTYSVNGRQYVAIAAGSNIFSFGF